MSVKRVLCGISLAGMTAASLAAFGQQTTPADQPTYYYATPPAAVVVPPANVVTTPSGAVVTTPAASPSVIWVPAYQTVPLYSVPVYGAPSGDYGTPGWGTHHPADIG